MMSVGEYFELADQLPTAPLDDLVGAGGLVVVAPHPDDETLGCGGLLALCAQTNRPCSIVIVSDGSGSHPNSTAWPPSALRNLREEETMRAVETLGLTRDVVTFLRAPDRFVPSEGPDAEQLAQSISRIAQDISASAIAVTWRHDPHCDHAASWKLCAKAVSGMPNRPSLLAYPVWGHTLESVQFEQAPRGHRLFVGEVLEVKRRALACHASQVTPLINDDPSGFVLSNEMISRFTRPYEIFFTTGDCP